jgi:hypothetical protein
MAMSKDIGAVRIAYPGKMGETILLVMHISKEDELKINGVTVILPEECYNVNYQ